MPGSSSFARKRVAGPDGAEFDRHVVHHPGAVVVVPVDDDGRVLMVRQYRVAVGAALLEVPAGKRDVDGEPPEATAARELEEELGRVPGRLRALCEFYNSPGFTDEYTYLFLATELGHSERAATSAEEQAMTIERIAFADVDALIASRRDCRRQEHHRLAARTPPPRRRVPGHLTSAYGSSRARVTSASPICSRSTRPGCGWSAGWRRTRSPRTAVICAGTRALCVESVSSIRPR